MRIGGINIGGGSTVTPEQQKTPVTSDNGATTGLAARQSSKSSFAPRMSLGALKPDFKALKQDFKALKKDIKQDFKAIKQDFKAIKQDIKQDFKQFKSNVSGMGDSLKQSLSSLGGTSKPPTPSTMPGADFKAQASKIAGEILTEKAAALGNIDIKSIETKMFDGEAKPLAEGNGDLRRLATVLEASTKVADVSVLPEGIRSEVAALQDFYARREVKEGLIQACTSEWHMKEQTLSQKFIVSDQLKEAKNLLNDLNDAANR